MTMSLLTIIHDEKKQFTVAFVRLRMIKNLYYQIFIFSFIDS